MNGINYLFNTSEQSHKIHAYLYHTTYPDLKQVSCPHVHPFPIWLLVAMHYHVGLERKQPLQDRIRSVM
jgi:hypothetical protein